MNHLNDEEILSLLNQSKFKALGPFEFVHENHDTPRMIDTRYGRKCYILKSIKGGPYFYVYLDKTVAQEKIET